MQEHVPSHVENEIAGRRIVFMIGSPRSGTTWLQLMLGSSEAVATVNETHLFCSYTSSMFSGWTMFQDEPREIGLGPLLSEDEYLGLVRSFCAGVLGSILARKPRAYVILEKTPSHAAHWREILKVFPQAYFLHLVRDPRAVVASLQAVKTSGWGARWVGSRTTQNILLWSNMSQEGHSVAAHTENFLEIRYEDLKCDGAANLHRIFSWMGVGCSFDRCQSIFAEYSVDNLRKGGVSGASWNPAAEPDGFYRRGETEGWRQELTPIQIHMVETMTSELMATFGYQPVASSSILLSFLTPARLQLYERLRDGFSAVKRAAMSSFLRVGA